MAYETCLHLLIFLSFLRLTFACARYLHQLCNELKAMMLPKTKHLKCISISIYFRCFVFPMTCQFPLVWRHVLPLYFPDPKPVAGCYGEKNQTSPDILFTWNDMDAWWEELKLMSCYSPDGTANCHVSPFLNQMSNGPFRET